MLSLTRARVRSIASNPFQCSRCSLSISATIVNPAFRRARPSVSTEEAGNSSRAYSRRGYATEADVIPKSILIRSPRPPAPTTQGQPPESATSLQPPLTRLDQLDGLLLHFHERVFASDGSCATIPDLYDQLSSNAGKVVDHELPFEDTPLVDRKVPTSISAPDKTKRTSWLESCKLAEARLSSEASTQAEHEDGLVLVAHIVDSNPTPIMSWSLGFVITTKEGAQYIVSCSHTLESVGIGKSFAPKLPFD